MGSFEQRGCANRKAAPRCSNPKGAGSGEECHFNFARRAPFLTCTDTVVRSRRDGSTIRP
jgi:hypothetical protein